MSKIQLRKASGKDIDLYFKWLNDPQVREKSFDSRIVKWEEHVKWFNNKINDPDYTFYIFNINKESIGQVRIHKVKESESEIGVSVGAQFRGLGYGSQMLRDACKDYFSNSSIKVINAYIKSDNLSSIKIFENAGFILLKMFLFKSTHTKQFVLYADREL